MKNSWDFFWIIIPFSVIGWAVIAGVKSAPKARVERAQVCRTKVRPFFSSFASCAYFSFSLFSYSLSPLLIVIVITHSRLFSFSPSACNVRFSCFVCISYSPLFIYLVILRMDFFDSMRPLQQQPMRAEEKIEGENVLYNKSISVR